MAADIETQAPRYESKFVLNYEQALGLSRLLHTHPDHFRTLFPPRQINNIYFDTADFAHFRENIAGVSPRKKVRLRWYGNWHGNNKESDLSLEIKSKAGEVVTKSVLQVEEKFSSNSQLPAIISGKYLEQAGIYHPVLINSYWRQYLSTADESIRLTVDTELRFGRPEDSFEPQSAANLPHSIVELKYDLSAQNRASQVSRYLPFRLSKSSKYEMGISNCYPHLVIL